MHFTIASAFLREVKVLKGIPWQEHTSNLSLCLWSVACIEHSAQILKPVKDKQC